MVIRRILLIGFIVFVSFYGCSEDYTEVRFKITCTGNYYPGEFTGYYFVDGGETREIPADSIEQIDSYTYSYTSGIFENFDELEIYARRLNYDADLIIRVYENGEKVETATLAADYDEDDSDIDYLILSYEYEEGQADDESEE